MVGKQVAWTMGDGNTMAGEVTHQGYSKLTVRRIDGGICTVDMKDVREATPDDIESAVKFFQNIGK